MKTFYILVLSFFYSIFFFSIQRFIANKLKIFDYPNKRKIHTAKVPLTGGIGVYILIVILFFLDFLDQSIIDINEIFKLNLLNLNIFFYTLTALFLIGLLDDKFTLNTKQKIIPTILVCSFFILSQPTIIINGIYIFGYLVDLKTLNLSFIFTILSFFLFMNAFNMYDGVNLQSAFYSIFFFSNLYLINHHIFILIIIVYLIVFSFFNNKNKTFMGEAGCMLISFILSIYCINFYSSNEILVEQIIILMLFPGLEIMRLFFVRIINKNSPFKPDKNHLHHHLIQNYKQIYSVFYFIVIYIFKTYLIIYYSNLFSIIILIFIYFVTIIYVKRKNYKFN